MTGQFIIAEQSADTRHQFLWKIPYLLTNALFFGFYFTCMRSSRVEWTPSLDVLLTHYRRERRPLVYYAWHGDSWWLISAILVLPPELRPVGVCNNGAISRMNSFASTWLGVDMFEYSRDSAVTPRQQIIEFVRDSGRHIMVFPDAGGPYRQLKPGILSIARDAGADLVPVRLDVRPALKVGRNMQHCVPTPFARLRTSWGMPLPADQTSAAMAETALRALHEVI